MKVVAKRKWNYPLSQERLYAKYLVAYVERKFKVIQAFIPELKDVILTYGIKTDADDDMTLVNAHMNVAIDQMTQAVESPDVMRPVIQRMFQNVDAYALHEFNAITKSLFGFPLPELLRQVPPTNARTDAAVDDEIAKYRDIWVQNNLDLIKSIDAETMQKIRARMAERIIHTVDANLLTKYLIQDLQDLAGVEVRRATLIGVDQVGKLNGQLAQFRQEFAGISEYRWETAGDERVRPAHRLRQGKLFKWSNPPPDGHPGYPIRCRCVADPVIDLDMIPIRVKPGKFEAIQDVNAYGIIHSKGEPMNSEYQRYGRNKNTTIDKSVIESGTYRRKFDELTDSAVINRTLYEKAKEILYHRSGTKFEDMYWFDAQSGEVIASVLDEKTEEEIVYRKSVMKKVKKVRKVIAMHSHPGSMPPSAGDFNAMFYSGYVLGIVVCHDGKIFWYKSFQEISEQLYKLYIADFIKKGYDEYESQILALKKLMNSYNIEFKEVVIDERK